MSGHEELLGEPRRRAKATLHRAIHSGHCVCSFRSPRKFKSDLLHSELQVDRGTNRDVHVVLWQRLTLTLARPSSAVSSSPFV